jgi:hypothetical protein
MHDSVLHRDLLKSDHVGSEEWVEGTKEDGSSLPR